MKISLAGPKQPDPEGGGGRYVRTPVIMGRIDVPSYVLVVLVPCARMSASLNQLSLLGVTDAAAPERSGGGGRHTTHTVSVNPVTHTRAVGAETVA